MGNQPEITSKMRATLTDWLIESHQRFHLMPETLYLTIYIVDRYLSLQPVPRRELQLVGMAAMLIACKYEEIWAPEVRPKLHSYLAVYSGCSKPENFLSQVNDFIEIADCAFNRHQILVAEKAILNSMQWNLTVPTPYHFLLRFAKAAGSADEQVKKELLRLPSVASHHVCVLFRFCAELLTADTSARTGAASAYDLFLRRARADGLRYGDDISFDGCCLRCLCCSPHVEEESSLDRNLEASHWPPRAAAYVSALLLPCCTP
jgi:hypothetical protein